MEACHFFVKCHGWDFYLIVEGRGATVTEMLKLNTEAWLGKKKKKLTLSQGNAQLPPCVLKKKKKAIISWGVLCQMQNI